MICIAGKNKIAIETAKFLKTKGFIITAVINKNDNGINSWQPSFKKYCLDNGIQILTLQQLYEVEELNLISLEFDQIIDTKSFKSKKLFNIHFSKLPKYKGMYTSAMPILLGEQETGVTLHLIDDGIDTGDVIDQFTIALNNQINAEQLYKKYIECGTRLILKNIEKLLANDFTAKPQDFRESSYYSKKTIDYANLKVDLQNTAYHIHNQIRAFSFRSFQLPKVKDHFIYRSEIVQKKSLGKSGTVVEDTEWFIVLNTIDYQIKLFKDNPQFLSIAKTGDVKSLVLHQANGYWLKSKSLEGWDLLIVAAYYNQIEFCKYLLDELFWDVNVANYKGTTAVMYAMTAAGKFKDLELLKLFLSKEPDLYRYDDAKKNIFDYAFEYGNQNVIELLNLYKN